MLFLGAVAVLVGFAFGIWFLWLPGAAFVLSWAVLSASGRHAKRKRLWH
jgi:hypothetical protein